MGVTLTIKIKVASYSGHTAEESPRSFIADGRNIKVAHILKMWLEEDAKERGRRRFFRVRGEDGRVYLLCYDEVSMDWWLVP